MNILMALWKKIRSWRSNTADGVIIWLEEDKDLGLGRLMGYIFNGGRNPIVMRYCVLQIEHLSNDYIIDVECDSLSRHNGEWIADKTTEISIPNLNGFLFNWTKPYDYGPIYTNCHQQHDWFFQLMIDVISRERLPSVIRCRAVGISETDKRYYSNWLSVDMSQCKLPRRTRRSWQEKLHDSREYVRRINRRRNESGSC